MSRRRVQGAMVALLLGALAACEYPFQPFQETRETPFIMFGFLDLYADTQLVRVMPVRQNVLLSPELIDAVVTLEQLGSGRVVTLEDSLVSFRDVHLDVVVYAYNYWTTEPLEPGAEYRLTATRSDGAATTAHVTMPREPEYSIGRGPTALPLGYLVVRAGQAPFVDVIHTVTNGGHVYGIAEPQKGTFPDGPTEYGFAITGEVPLGFPMGVHSTGRLEVRITTAPADWPFRPGGEDLSSAVIDTIPTNVAGGFGYVAGVATRTIPFPHCEVVRRRPIATRVCTNVIDAGSASIVGRVTREPCGTPYHLGAVRLVERFADGGVEIRTWVTTQQGEYWFEGIEPGSDLVVELQPGVPAARLPRLGPGERYAVEDLSLEGGC